MYKKGYVITKVMLSILCVFLGFKIITTNNFLDRSNKDLQNMSDKISSMKYTDEVYRNNTEGMTSEDIVANNIFVEDFAEMLTAKQKEEIYKLNINNLSNLKGKPTIYVKTFKQSNDMYTEYSILSTHQHLDNAVYILGSPKENTYSDLKVVAGVDLKDIVSQDYIENTTSEAIKINLGLGLDILSVSDSVVKKLSESALGTNKIAIDKYSERVARDVKTYKQNQKKYFIFASILIIFYILITVIYISLNKYRKQLLVLFHKVLEVENYKDEAVIQTVYKHLNAKIFEAVFITKDKDVIIYGLIDKYKENFDKSIKAHFEKIKIPLTQGDIHNYYDYTSLKKTANSLQEYTALINEKAEQLIEDYPFTDKTKSLKINKAFKAKVVMTIQEQVFKEPIEDFENQLSKVDVRAIRENM